MYYLGVGRGISAEELRLLNARRVPTVHAGVVPAKIRIRGARHGKSWTIVLKSIGHSANTYRQKGGF